MISEQKQVSPTPASFAKRQDYPNHFLNSNNMKKLLGFSLVVMAVAVFFATKNVDQSGTVRLADLATLNTANAECNSGPLDSGRCSFFGNCWWDPDYAECSPF